MVSKLATDLRSDISREALAEAMAVYEGAFADASATIRPLNLSGRRAARSAGWVRSQLVEEGFERMHTLHGAVMLPEGLIPNTAYRLFQPYGVYGRTLLGFGTMPEPRHLPSANRTRRRSASLNRQYAPELPLEEPVLCEQIDRCALILACRDPSNMSCAEEIAIAAISPQYDAFLFYESLTTFMESYAPEPASKGMDGPIPGLRLRPTRKKKKGGEDRG